MKALLRGLLHLFPRGFRSKFGPQMAEQLDTEYDRATGRGFLTTLSFASTTVFDLARAALAEHIRPTWAPDQASETGTRRRDMSTSIEDWTKDLGLAVRTLRRSPGFTVVAVVTLGLAMGASTGIFGVVDKVLLDPLPYGNADRLVRIAASAPGTELPDEFGVSLEFYFHYAEESELLESLATYNWFTNTMRVGDRTERVAMSMPTISLFETLGAGPILGRLPVPQDESRVAVISHAAWTSWFGGDPTVIGRTAFIGGANRTVIGVMGPDFWFPNEEVLAWVPWPVVAEDITPGRFNLRLVGRVAPGTTHDDLAAELDRLALRLPDRFGGSSNYETIIGRHRAIVRSLEEELLGDVQGPLWILMGSVIIVLLVACANVANLFTVRGERRQRDLAVRKALGAGRRALVRALMAEAVLIAALAGGLAVLLAWLSVPLLVQAAPDNVPRLADADISGSALLFTLGACTFAALACGLIPAVRASSPSLDRLRDAGRGSTARGTWTRDGLVVGQTALALVLLIGSGLLVRSFWELRDVDPGYSTEDVFTFQIAPERDDLTDPPSWAAFHMDFAQRIRALPGVESVGIVENVPLDEGVSGTRLFTEATMGGPGDGALAYFTFTGEDYFETMGIAVLEGRSFRRSDHVSELANVVVSRSAADMLWPGESPAGKRVRGPEQDEWQTVVGVVDDVLQYGFRGDPLPMIYYPMAAPIPIARPLSSPAYVVKTARAGEIAPEIREIVREIAPTAPMYRMYTMDGLAADSMIHLSFTMLTLGIASMLALSLGAVGLFGVLSYVVAGRTREIGLRMALGAEPRRVRRMVVAQGTRFVGLGVLLGVAASMAGTRALRSLLYGVDAIDLGTFAGMSLAMILVGLVASYLPARRASNVDPIRSLQGE